MKACIYLIPNTLGQENSEDFLPKSSIEIVKNLRFFAVEEIKSARRLLRKIDKNFPIDESTFFVLDKYTKIEALQDVLKVLSDGNNLGIISEAGTPCIADPGSILVDKAHECNIYVKPLIGPSSIILALMSSGLNGQNFTFHGYLPKERENRIKKLKEIENQTNKSNITHIFIETPYRNQHLFDDIILNLSNDLKLCLAKNLTCQNESIKTKTIFNWKKESKKFNKEQCVFILGKSI